MTEGHPAVDKVEVDTTIARATVEITAILATNRAEVAAEIGDPAVAVDRDLTVDRAKLVTEIARATKENHSSTIRLPVKNIDQVKFNAPDLKILRKNW